ncbi:hypothetical protein Hanom_Chr06g00479641 [Helianthus anomalus]
MQRLLGLSQSSHCLWIICLWVRQVISLRTVWFRLPEKGNMDRVVDDDSPYGQGSSYTLHGLKSYYEHYTSFHFLGGIDFDC